MNKKPRQINSEFIADCTNRVKTNCKAPKGKRIVAVNQYDQILIVDDKGYVVAVKNRA